MRVTPRYITRVTDYEGRVLEEDFPEVKDVISERTARIMTGMLREVVLHGTGVAAARLPFPVAGKTGTTNDFTDAWFVGFSPTMTCGVWVGYDERRSLGAKETGAHAALPIWINFMTPAMAGKDPGDFQPPPVSTRPPIEKVDLLTPLPPQKNRTERAPLYQLSCCLRMRAIVLLLVICLFSSLSHAQSSKELAKVVGSWEGESKCTVPDSPCHDEHVLYQFSVNQKTNPQLNLDAYKIVDGSPEFMGTLACQYHGKQESLSCTGNTSKQDDWEFHFFGDSMAGKLTIEGGKLYRRIALHKVKDK